MTLLLQTTGPLHLALIIVLLALNLLDLLTTIHAVESHAGTEANPIVAALIRTFGLRAGLAIDKLSAVGIMLVVGIHLIAVWTLLLLISLYAWVCWHNYRLARA